MKNYYEILGVSPSSEIEVITAAYKAMMRKSGPEFEDEVSDKDGTPKGENSHGRVCALRHCSGENFLAFLVEVNVVPKEKGLVLPLGVDGSHVDKLDFLVLQYRLDWRVSEFRPAFHFLLRVVPYDAQGDTVSAEPCEHIFQRLFALNPLPITRGSRLCVTQPDLHND